MSLASMIRQTLGIQAPQDHVKRGVDGVLGLASLAAGAGVSGYMNGRFPAAGRDHIAVKIPFTNSIVPADLFGIVTLHLLAAFVLEDYAEPVHDFANGVLGQYIGRVATRFGSEQRLVSQLPGGAAQGAAQIASGQSAAHRVSHLAGLVEIAGARARKYKMAG